MSATTTSDPRAAMEPWEARFRASAILFSQIAIDAPDVGLVTSNASGAPQLYRWDTATDDLVQLTHEPTGRLFGRLSPDGRWVAYLRDEAGSEVGHWVVLPVAGGDEVDVTSGLAPYSSDDFAFSRTDGRVAFMTAADDRFSVRMATLGTDGTAADVRTVHDTGASLTALAISADGRFVAFSSAHRSNGLEFSALAVDADSGEVAGELWDGERTSIVAHSFGPRTADRRLLATTNRSGRERAVVWNVGTGERIDLPIDAPDGDLLPLDWSPDGGSVLLVRIDEAEQQLHVWDLDRGVTRPLDHPTGALIGYLRLSASYFRPDGGEIVCRWESFDQPRRLIGLDPATGRQTRTILASGLVPPGHAFRSVSIPSADGGHLQAWLGVPDGEPPFPVVLETHGGPTAVQSANFHATGQAFIDAGFAFLSLNYHGSTTFGREFEQSIWGRLGELELQDLISAREWLVVNRVGLPDRIFLTGWSYGGYLTLLGLSKAPSLWAGGMAGAAIADWELNYEDESDTLRAYDRMLFGGWPEETADARRAGSPLTYVDDVRAPVLIVQGRNDSRTPARQVEVFVERLRARQHPVEIEWYDAGHVGGDDALAVHHQRLMQDFALRIASEPR